jgi:hypothetical protein
LVAAPGLASTLTAGVADQLRADLEAAFPSVGWAPEVITDQALVIPPAGVAEQNQQLAVGGQIHESTRSGSRPLKRPARRAH